MSGVMVALCVRIIKSLYLLTGHREEEIAEGLYDAFESL